MMEAIPIVDEIVKIIDKIIPDPAQKAQAQLALLQLKQSGELNDLNVRISAILAEAKSNDPWTSRARPSFLYVMYIMILIAPIMGIISVFSTDTATQIGTGMQAWLGSIPDALWGMMGAGYLGYCGARSFDKKQIIHGKGRGNG